MNDGRYIEEQKMIRTNQVMYASMLIEKPVSKKAVVKKAKYIIYKCN